MLTSVVDTHLNTFHIELSFSAEADITIYATFQATEARAYQYPALLSRSLTSQMGDAGYQPIGYSSVQKGIQIDI